MWSGISMKFWITALPEGRARTETATQVCSHESLLSTRLVWLEQGCTPEGPEPPRTTQDILCHYPNEHWALIGHCFLCLIALHGYICWHAPLGQDGGETGLKPDVYSRPINLRHLLFANNSPGLSLLIFKISLKIKFDHKCKSVLQFMSSDLNTHSLLWF